MEARLVENIRKFERMPIEFEHRQRPFDVPIAIAKRRALATPVPNGSFLAGRADGCFDPRSLASQNGFVKPKVENADLVLLSAVMRTAELAEAGHQRVSAMSVRVVP